jgi:hypothetical protein
MFPLPRSPETENLIPSLVTEMTTAAEHGRVGVCV